MNFENVLKGFFTTLLGCVLMGLACYEWWIQTTETTDWWQVGIPFICGFALLFMRDKVSEFIGELFKAAIRKITGNNPPPTPKQ